ncbi:MAG TPA: hypothetical protein VMO26_09005 [Vicinamibacterales bacterium]|nr:hypothetical protein [Vicinamibacterales bacterium]
MNADLTLSRDEDALLVTYRESLQNDRALLPLLLAAWARLSPAQREAIYRVADLFVCAASWRKGPLEETPQRREGAS